MTTSKEWIHLEEEGRMTTSKEQIYLADEGRITMVEIGREQSMRTIPQNLTVYESTLTLHSLSTLLHSPSSLHSLYTHY